jgi:hypothetical protein
MDLGVVMVLYVHEMHWLEVRRLEITDWSGVEYFLIRWLTTTPSHSSRGIVYMS